MDNTDLIKQKINIVDLIAEYLPLKKSGVNFKTNCPFHNEKTPSFVVSPERGIWHCFGCDRGGDIFKFVMEKEGMEFKDALAILAQKAGITLKKTKQTQDPSDRLFEVNQKAQQFFHHLLTKHKIGQKALDYLKKRGLGFQTIEQFGLGYAPLNWESLTNFLKKRGFSIQEIIACGLAIPSTRQCYDRFRGRITFPLIDIRERIIGFSGRILNHGEPFDSAQGGPKYINSPQTPIFDKGRFLFGLHLSKGEIREKKSAIVVEGEIDMILSYQSGVKNIVASKGTALTEGQISIVQKYAEEVNLCFDTDLAGDAASKRGIEIADKAGLNIKVIQIEGGKDPAEICLKDSSLWRQMVDKATPIYDYYLKSASIRFDPKTAEGKKAISGELLPILSKIHNPMVKEHYIQKLASFLQVKEELIRSQTNTNFYQKLNLKSLDQALKRKDDKIDIPDRRKLLEEYLIALILHIPSDLTYVPNFPESMFTEDNLKQIFVLLVLYFDSISYKGESFKINDFIRTVPEELSLIVDRLYLTEIDDKLKNSGLFQKELDVVISELKKMLIKSSLEKLSLKIKNAQDFDKMETLELLNKRFRDLSVKLKIYDK